MGGDPWDQPQTDPTKPLPPLDLGKIARTVTTGVGARWPRASRKVRDMAVAFASRAERIAAAEAFTPGPGLKLKGSPNDQKVFLDMVKREMVTSPSFSALMLAMNRDAAHPVEVTLGRNQRGVFMDSFDSQFTAGQQEIDLADLKKLPRDPPAGYPDAVTQGELLAHAMAEARVGAEGDEYSPAHEAGIKAQNDYRDDRGQSGHRKDIRLEPNRAGNLDVNYDNGYSEVWVRSEGRLIEVNRYRPASP